MKIMSIPSTLSLLFVFACGGSQTPANETHSPAASATAPDKEVTQDIVGIAAGSEQFTTLVAALTAADLVGALQGEVPFTVFAPTDAAFAKLPKGTVEALLADKEKLIQVLTYHVVAGRVMAADVGGLDSAMTLQGQSLSIDTTNGVQIGNAVVETADIVASNGVIHVIDTVLIPN